MTTDDLLPNQYIPASKQSCDDDLDFCFTGMNAVQTEMLSIYQNCDF